MNFSLKWFIFLIWFPLSVFMLDYSLLSMGIESFDNNPSHNLIYCTSHPWFTNSFYLLIYYIIITYILIDLFYLLILSDYITIYFMFYSYILSKNAALAGIVISRIVSLLQCSYLLVRHGIAGPLFLSIFPSILSLKCRNYKEQ